MFGDTPLLMVEDPEALAELVEALRGGAQTVGGVVRQVYRDVDREYHPLAAISVAAHVRKLADEGKVVFHEKQADELWEALIKMVDAK